MTRPSCTLLYLYGLAGMIATVTLAAAPLLIPVAAPSASFIATITILTVITLVFLALLILRAVRATQQAETSAAELEKSNNLFARSNKELEQFAYVASHDLKAPLRHIDNLAQWVIEDTQDLLPAEAAGKLAMLRDRVKRLDRLLNDILTYSRAGRIVDAPTQINLKELLQDLAESHLPTGFTITLPDNLPILQAGRTPLEQIWGNIFSNAVKHHDQPQGTITVSVHDKGDFYEFIALDDGPGIPDAQHERVFEIFQTLQSRDKVEGCGLGLSIIRKLVDYHGGRVWIAPADGARGTALHFLWPKTINY